MNDNPPPLGIHPDDQLEARITAWVLGEASPFEIAELESLVAKSPELQLFLNRTRALHALLQEAENTANTPSEDWKLPAEKRDKLDDILGAIPVLIPYKESRIRRASFRAAWGIAAVFVVTFFSLRLLPRDYEAEAVIEIKPRQRMIGEISQGPVMTPMFFGTEFEKIKSRNSLEKVIDDLDLTARWNTDKETALKRLKDSVETENIRGTDLIAIRVRQPDEQDAKEITRAVTEGYRDYRNSLEEKQKELAVNELRKAVREMEDKVEDRRKILTTISRTKNISYSGDRNLAQGGFDENSEANSASNMYSELEGEKKQLESQIQSLLKYDSDQLLTYASGLDLPDNTVKSIYPQYLEQKRQIEGLKASGLAENHPTLRNNRKVLDSMKGDLDESVVNLRTRLQGQLDMSKERLAKVEVRKKESKNSALERSIDTSDYVDAKRDFETDLALLEQMKLKLITEEISSDLPDDGIVIHEDPAITGRKFPSNPLAAFKEAITPDAKLSEPLALAEYSVPAAKEGSPSADQRSELLGDKMEIAENDRDARPRVIPPAPAAPSASMGKVIAAQAASPVQIPVPDIAMLEQSTDFGDGDDFGGGFADKGDRSGDKPIARNSIDAILNNPDRTAANRKPAAPAASAPIADSARLRQSATQPEKKKREANEQVDPFAEPDAPGEIASLTGLFSDGIDSDFKEGKEGAGSNIRFNMDLRAGAERSADYFYSDFDGFTNYGAPIAGQPKQKKITTKHVEITQANDTELAFDWIVSPFNEKDAGLVFPVTPATPTGFESRLTGGTLEVAPILGDIPVVGRLFQEKQPIDLADLSQEIPAAQEPFSTFSLNISDASFQLALAAVEKGERPDPESIKPEQFYNAVDYGDPAPSSLEPVAAAIDQTAHPVIPGRNLVRVAIRTASTGRSAAQPLRLTLLVDQSGSMARADRRAAMDTALAQLATLLTENDRITVIGFSRTPRLIADSLPGNEAAKIPDLINTTASEGGTNLEQAFNLSSELALRHKLDGAQNRIVLFTDGAANLGDADPDRLAGRVKELRQQGLAFDIAGIGTNDTNDRLLGELARHGNGRYYLVGENTGASLAAQLAGAFRPAAENVKVQVKLNPERVGSYKLIGFEKDRLKTEDFRDDSVDAAELAADEAGVAIYQVETLPEGTGEIGEVSVRFRDTASGEMVERAWTIPHDPSTPAFDKADPKTQLATLALLAAQKLQGGPLADAIRFPDHVETIAKLKQAYANDEKTQRLLTLINALR